MLRLRPVYENGTVRDHKGRRTSPQEEGVVSLHGDKIVGSMDWEWAFDDVVSIENLWVDPEYLRKRCSDVEVTVGVYANPKVKRLVSALNRV